MTSEDPMVRAERLHQATTKILRAGGRAVTYEEFVDADELCTAMLEAVITVFAWRFVDAEEAFRCLRESIEHCHSDPEYMKDLAEEASRFDRTGIRQIVQ